MSSRTTVFAVSISALTTLFTSSCEKSEPSSPEPTGKVSEPAAEPVPKKMEPIKDSGTVSFTVTGGENEGVYAGILSKDSSMKVQSMGADSVLIFLKAIHQPTDALTFQFALNIEVEAAVPGTYDVTGKMATISVVDENDPTKTVGINTMQGSGTVEITEIDPDTRAIKGTFTLEENGQKAVGSFTKLPR